MLRLWKASIFIIALVIDSSYEKVTPVDSETFETISHFQLLPPAPWLLFLAVQLHVQPKIFELVG